MNTYVYMYACCGNVLLLFVLLAGCIEGYMCEKFPSSAKTALIWTSDRTLHEHPTWRRAMEDEQMGDSCVWADRYDIEV